MNAVSLFEDALEYPAGPTIELRKYVARRIGGQWVYANYDADRADGRPLLALTRETSRLAPFASKADAIATLAWFAELPELAIGHAFDGLLAGNSNLLQ